MQSLLRDLMWQASSVLLADASSAQGMRSRKGKGKVRMWLQYYGGSITKLANTVVTYANVLAGIRQANAFPKPLSHVECKQPCTAIVQYMRMGGAAHEPLVQRY